MSYADLETTVRYIALLAIHKLLPSHPHLIASYSTMILKCVDDADSSIRHRALDLVEGMVDQHTLPNVVRKLLTQLTGSQYKDRHLSSPAAAALSSIANSNGSNASSGASSIHSPAYKSSVIHRILRILQQNNYANVSDFEWLVDLLIELAFIAATLPQSTTLQQSIGQVLVDVSARARAIRPYAVKKCIHLLSSAHPSNDNTLGEHVAWIVGEYCTADDDDNPLEWQAAITALREAEQTHSAVKVFAKWAAHVSDSGSWRESGGEALKAVRSEAEALRESEDVQSVGLFDLHELFLRAQWPRMQAHELLALLTMTAANLEQPDVPPTFSTTTTQEDNPFASDGQVSKEVDLSSGAPLGLRLLKSLYLPELNPVNPRAQSLVGVPEGLDLDAWIVPNSIINLPAESSAMAAERDEVDEFGRPRGVFASVTAQSLELLGGNGKTERTKEKKKKKGRKGESEGEDGRKVCTFLHHCLEIYCLIKPNFRRGNQNVAKMGTMTKMLTTFLSSSWTSPTSLALPNPKLGLRSKAKARTQQLSLLFLTSMASFLPKRYDALPYLLPPRPTRLLRQHLLLKSSKSLHKQRQIHHNRPLPRSSSSLCK